MFEKFWANFRIFQSRKGEFTKLLGGRDHLRLLRTFAGVLREKIRMRAILNENTANYISLERLINVDFGEKKSMNRRFL